MSSASALRRSWMIRVEQASPSPGQDDGQTAGPLRPTLVLKTFNHNVRSPGDRGLRETTPPQSVRAARLNPPHHSFHVQINYDVRICPFHSVNHAIEVDVAACV